MARVRQGEILRHKVEDVERRDKEVCTYVKYFRDSMHSVGLLHYQNECGVTLKKYYILLVPL